ncbi:MAG TPA: DNA recombination protein RmuC [bacterium]|nr:DNA recombination protein RmuC [bacterium]HPP11122.1 DNA recombination protein RmuC [bacterium]
MAVVFLWVQSRRQDALKLAQELLTQAQNQRLQEMETILARLKDSFSSVSMEALSENTRQFLALAGETLARYTSSGVQELEKRKELIDQTLEAMKQNLQNVQEVIGTIEKERRQQFGQIETHLKVAAEQTSRLQETTSQLKQALAGAGVRGRWGERMAEDVLRLAGFIEGINYQKQKKIEQANTKPDYTFFLPQGLKLHMDVKFPLDNYVHYLEAKTDIEREQYRKNFLRDVRERIKSVTTRDYINPENNTLDYAIVFIPNEQVYAFINEHDRSILDEALNQKIIVCSPLTLYAILAVIRQAVDNFNLERAASDILVHLGEFAKQWQLFVKAMEKMGQKIEEAHREYQELTGRRKRMLETTLNEIEELRQQKNIPPLLTAGDEKNQEPS